MHDPSLHSGFRLKAPVARAPHALKTAQVRSCPPPPYPCTILRFTQDFASRLPSARAPHALKTAQVRSCLRHHIHARSFASLRISPQGSRRSRSSRLENGSSSILPPPPAFALRASARQAIAFQSGFGSAGHRFALLLRACPCKMLQFAHIGTHERSFPADRSRSRNHRP